jgi:DNA-directed RNA polymerase subunit F
MSNTIPLRLEDIDRRGYLYQKFKTGNIRPEEIVELRQILENERYLAISEGNLQILFSITTILKKIMNL